MNFILRLVKLIVALVLLVIPMLSDAHTGHSYGDSIGFISGFMHPFTGIDHILILLAVGIGCSKTGIQAQLSLLAVFMLLTLVGGMVSFSVEVNQLQDFIEITGVVSVLLLFLANKAFKQSIELFVIEILALFHGYIHAYDMLLDTDAYLFTVGFMVSTGLVLSLGMLLRWAMQWVYRYSTHSIMKASN